MACRFDKDIILHSRTSSSFGSKHYRLSTHPDFLTFDKKKLKTHPDPQIIALIKKLG
jgi:hypothetical protein